MTRTPPETIGIVGYGEVGRAFAERSAGLGIDTLVTNRSPENLRRTVESVPNVEVASDPSAVAAGSDLVLSCVWPETAVEVAAAAAPALEGGLFVDLNSIGVATVREVTRTIEAEDCLFLNTSIMGSVKRHGADAPLAASGYPIEEGTRTLRELGFDIEAYGKDPERAAVLKMCRSAVTKGLLVVLTEALLPARAHGLHAEVLDSVDRSFADQTLGDFARLFLVDMTEHGARRAGELDEVIATIRDGGHDATVSERARWLSEQLAMLDGEDYEKVLARLDEATRPADP
ncbi:MAG: NAD(P)-binding domain-containing protein [Halapricum sp.]